MNATMYDAFLNEVAGHNDVMIHETCFENHERKEKQFRIRKYNTDQYRINYIENGISKLDSMGLSGEKVIFFVSAFLYEESVKKWLSGVEEQKAQLSETRERLEGLISSVSSKVDEQKFLMKAVKKITSDENKLFVKLNGDDIYMEEFKVIDGILVMQFLRKYSKPFIVDFLSEEDILKKILLEKDKIVF